MIRFDTGNDLSIIFLFTHTGYAGKHDGSFLRASVSVFNSSTHIQVLKHNEHGSSALHSSFSNVTRVQAPCASASGERARCSHRILQPKFYIIAPINIITRYIGTYVYATRLVPLCTVIYVEREQQNNFKCVLFYFFLRSEITKLYVVVLEKI